MCNEGDLSDIRKAAKAIIDKNVPVKTQFTSDGSRETFDRLTNGTPKTHPSRHDYLVDVWAKGSQETCCMDFVAWYGKQLAAALGFTMTENLGRFDLVEKGIAKPSAWVKTAPSPKPKYGDILLHTGIHIDVAIGFDGKHLCRVAAGQGIVKQRDIIKRVTGDFEYNYQKLKGWVDIDVYFGSAAAPTPGPTPTNTIMPPPWLYGWWKVTWRGEAFLYYFYRDGSMAWTQNMKQSTSQAPGAVQGRGRFVVDHTMNVFVYWDSGSVETFKSTSNTQLTGTWKSKDGSQAPLSATKVQSGGWV